jgi:hypothetical protein
MTDLVIDLLALIGLGAGAGILLGLLHEALHATRPPLERRGFNVGRADHTRAARRLAKFSGKRP